jgi:lipopolysaccharide/colanic/teichoic acid biosynthesis glycosyltransferase/glycosyltransferase involved in cell wall biosynthesis
MKILVVHQYYLAPCQPGGSRFNEFARLWKARGHDVTVIAGTVNYVTGEQAPRSARGWVAEGAEEGIHVWRCHVPGTYNRGYLGRMWAFFGFTASACWAAIRAPLPDVVIATSPPLTASIPGFVAARMRWRPVPWVFEVRDLWPESAITTGVLSERSLLTGMLYRLERLACGHADRVNVLTPAFAEDLRKRGLVEDERLMFVPNGADVEAFTPVSRDNDARREFGWGDRFVALYAGAHGRANALHQLLDAAEHLHARTDILIALVGDGPERVRLEAEALRRNLSNLQFIGAVPKDRMPSVIAGADAGLAVLQNNPTFRTVYPNKVFDYMASGRPTVLAIDGVVRRLVCGEARAGLFAEPENGQAIADAIATLADCPAEAQVLGRNGREWVVANASRPALADIYLRALEALTSEPANAAAPSPAVAGRRFSGAADKGSVDPTVWKRLMDVVLAAGALIVLSPVLLLLAIVVRATIGSPVLFRQLRPGKGGRPFTILKFRTMRVPNGGPNDDAERLTTVGRALRALSLDELPELLNVVKGDMSLVGPRPLLMQYLGRYTHEQTRRHDVRPGITGWAQVNGRNALTWEEKFRLDVWYVDHCSFSLDLKILAMTIWKLATRDGVSQPGHATATEFFGSSEP